MIALGLIFSVIIFFLAEPLAMGLFGKPEAILPFQLIALNNTIQCNCRSNKRNIPGILSDDKYTDNKSI